MTPTLSPLANVESLGDLLERLGDIPASRVRLHPTPGTATEEDALALLEAPRKRICELIDGTLVEKAMGYKESVLAAFLIEALNQFIRPRNLGLISGADGMLRIEIGLVRIPVVAFVSWDRMPGRRRPTAPIPGLVPNLAVEVLSPSNTRREMERKRRELFAGGTILFWQIDPDERTVEVYTGPDTFTTLTASDTLTGDPVLPGFQLPLADLFAELDRHG